LHCKGQTQSSQGKLRVVTSPDRQWAAVISGGMCLDIISFSAVASQQREEKRHHLCALQIHGAFGRKHFSIL
jgi:hypothetical protein